MAVEPFGFEGVVEHVFADELFVRPIRGNVGDLFEFFTVLLSFAGSVGAVRFFAAVPETEGLVGIAFREEVVEVGRVVVIGN